MNNAGLVNNSLASAKIGINKDYNPIYNSGINTVKRQRVRGPVNVNTELNSIRRLRTNNALLSSGGADIGRIKAGRMTRYKGRDTYMGSAPRLQNQQGSKNYFLGGTGKINQLGKITNKLNSVKKPSSLSLVPGLVFKATKETSKKIRRLAGLIGPVMQTVGNLVNPGIERLQQVMSRNRRRISGPMNVTLEEGQLALPAPIGDSPVNDLSNRVSYTLNPVAMQVMSENVNFARNPDNRTLSPEQRRKLYSITHKNDGNEIKGGYDRETLTRNIIKKYPSMNKEVVKQIATIANSERARRERMERNKALEATRNSFNKDQANKEAAQKIAQGSAMMHFQNFTDTIGDKKLTAEQVKAIEAEARKNVEGRKDLKPEEVEAEYEKLKKELKKKKENENKKYVEDMALKLIADDPTQARAVLGEEGAKEYEKQMQKNARREEQEYATNLMKQRMEKNKAYMQAHPEKADLSPEEIAKQVEQEEMTQDINKATNSSNSENVPTNNPDNNVTQTVKNEQQQARTNPSIQHNVMYTVNPELIKVINERTNNNANTRK